MLTPPAADLRAAIEPKPVPPADLVTSEEAAARYDAAVESWGERLNAAGGRLCRWVLANGGTLPFSCPER